MIPAVSIRDLSFAYPEALQPALRGITVDIEPGSWTSLMGPSGAGKSTLAMCLNGLIPHLQRGAFSGQVAVLGRDTAGATVPELSALTGLLFQDFEAQLFSSQVDLEVAMALENFGVPRAEMRRRVAELLEAFGLSEFSSRNPAQLSGGQRQRLAIASVLALRPQVLVLDEPTTDLDPAGRELLTGIIRELRRDGTAIIWIDHEPELSLASDRLLVMDQGWLACRATAREFFTGPHLPEQYSIRPLDIPAVFCDLPREQRPLDFDSALNLMRRERMGPVRKPPREKDPRKMPSEASPGSIVIAAYRLGHTYPGGQTALRNIGLEVGRGEFLAIIGRNGSGKTTLAKHVNGLLKPTAGRMIVAGTDTRKAGIHQLSLLAGYCFQNPDHQIFAATVREEVAFGPRNHRLSLPQIEARVAEALDAVGLAGSEDRDPLALTKGERQRLAVASVLAMRPGIMVLDEPSTGLDYGQQLGMMALVDRLNREGMTILMITHALWLAARYAQRCLVMDGGRIVRDGPVAEVFRDEPALGPAGIVPPDIVRLGNALGAFTPTAGELRSLLGR